MKGGVPLRIHGNKFTGILFLLLCGMLAACVSVKSEVWIGEDGGGRVEIRYRLPSQLIDWLKQSEYGGQMSVVDGVDIPEGLSESHMREEISNVEGLSLSAYEVTREGDDIYVAFTIEFIQAGDLSGISFIPPISIDPGEETTEFSQSVCMQADIDTTNSEAVKIYKDYKNTFIVHAPRPITAHNMGRLEDDGQTLVFEYELLSSPECEQAGKDGGSGELTASW
jgi:hypothetical protein